MEEFQKKIRAKTPIGKLDQSEGTHPYQEKEPLQAFPNDINPHTGEVGKIYHFKWLIYFHLTSWNWDICYYHLKGGPRGPEPTRYGDWERKGRVSDF